MNASKHFQLSAFAAVATAALLALPAQAASMSRADYRAAKSSISDTYKADKKACSSRSGNVKDICVEEAKAKEKVARAELEFAYSGSAKDQTKVAVAKAESAYAVAKQRCDDQTGNSKDVCVKEAKAQKVRGLADAKMGKQISQARSDSAHSKMDAEYKVAAEKCESLAGDAKTSCMSSAKARFGKN